MKPGKHQRSKQRCQNLCLKVHDRAQSFVLRSYSRHELFFSLHESILPRKIYPRPIPPQLPNPGWRPNAPVKVNPDAPPTPGYVGLKWSFITILAAL